MKSIFIKVLIAIPVIYLALFIGFWSSVTDTRPIISLIDMVRSDGSTEIIDFSYDEKNHINQKPKPNKDRNPYYGDFMFIPNILLMPIYLVLQQHQMMHIDMLKEMASNIHSVMICN